MICAVSNPRFPYDVRREDPKIAGSCSDFEGGYRYRMIHMWENYDVKSTFEYTEAWYQSGFRESWDPINVHHCKSRWGDLMTRGGFSATTLLNGNELGLIETGPVNGPRTVLEWESCRATKFE